MSEQPDVKCSDPECGHLASKHCSAFSAIALHRSEVVDGLRRREDDLTAQLAASEVALAERDATITFLRGELAEARADYDDVLRERNEARAEVERRDGVAIELTETYIKASDETAARHAAERQRIASQVRYAAQLLRGRIYHSTRCQCLNTDVCVVVLQRDIERAAMGLDDEADRIASGGFATEEVRDGESRPSSFTRAMNAVYPATDEGSGE